MPALLLILDSLGTSELLLILVVALIFFGPRKLPQLSRQIGKSLAEFKRASEDFKRTWEREVQIESTTTEPEPTRTMPLENTYPDATIGRGQAPDPLPINAETNATVSEPNGSQSEFIKTAAGEQPQAEPAPKQEWF